MKKEEAKLKTKKLKNFSNLISQNSLVDTGAKYGRKKTWMNFSDGRETNKHKKRIHSNKNKKNFDSKKLTK